MQYLAALLVVLAYVTLCLVCWLHYRRRDYMPAVNALRSAKENLLIAYASQTGKAERIATQTAAQLHAAGVASELLPLNKLTASMLSAGGRMLFVVSTYGEGEAPDNGAHFLRRIAADQDLDLSPLNFAVLALGDSDYQHFCGFGHELARLLHHQGAMPLFDLIEVDKLDESALRHWQYYVGQLSGCSQFADWSKPDYHQWRLQERCCLNPESPGNAVYHLRLLPAAETVIPAHWQAGDIAEIGPCNSAKGIAAFLQTHALDGERKDEESGQRLFDMLRNRDLRYAPHNPAFSAMSPRQLLARLPELPHREYSIASVPQDGAVELLVRQTYDAQGGLGLGSGWLTEHAAINDSIALRIRSNANFHGPAPSIPMILIGNGTGIAGLRAHLRERIYQAEANQTQPRNWLFFGERTRANDFFFGDELLHWKKAGQLANLDIIFSRDVAADTAQPMRYVQHLLMEKRNYLKWWVEEQGAAIYVCGSLKGMAAEVDTALEKILGRDFLEQLSESGRYRRDVY